LSRFYDKKIEAPPAGRNILAQVERNFFGNRYLDNQDKWGILGKIRKGGAVCGVNIEMSYELTDERFERFNLDF